MSHPVTRKRHFRAEETSPETRACRPGSRHLLWPILVGLLTTGCATGLGDPCGLEQRCEDQSECVVGRCREVGVPLAPQGARRLVLQATKIRLVGGERFLSSDVVMLGEGPTAASAILFNFEAELSSQAEVVAAYFVVEADSHAAPLTSPVVLELFALSSPLVEGPAAQDHMPAASTALGAFQITNGQRRPIRIDVTDFVQARRGVGGGLMLRMDEGETSVALSVASHSPRGPRLELYLQ